MEECDEDDVKFDHKKPARKRSVSDPDPDKSIKCSPMMKLIEEPLSYW